MIRYPVGGGKGWAGTRRPRLRLTLPYYVSILTPTSFHGLVSEAAGLTPLSPASSMGRMCAGGMDRVGVRQLGDEMIA